MDIYGVNPIIHKGTKEPQRPKNLHEGASDEDVKEYFQKQLEGHSFTLPVQKVLKFYMTYKIQRSL